MAVSLYFKKKEIVKPTLAGVGNQQPLQVRMSGLFLLDERKL